MSLSANVIARVEQIQRKVIMKDRQKGLMLAIGATGTDTLS